MEQEKIIAQLEHLHQVYVTALEKKKTAVESLSYFDAAYWRTRERDIVDEASRILKMANREFGKTDFKKRIVFYLRVFELNYEEEKEACLEKQQQLRNQLKELEEKNNQTATKDRTSIVAIHTELEKLKLQIKHLEKKENEMENE
jgi:hypothetical protein